MTAVYKSDKFGTHIIEADITIEQLNTIHTYYTKGLRLKRWELEHFTLELGEDVFYCVEKIHKVEATFLNRNWSGAPDKNIRITITVTM